MNGPVAPSRCVRPLAQWLAEHAQATAAQRLDIARQVAAALESLHAAGRLHGAVDAERVAIDEQGQVHLETPAESVRFGGERDSLEYCPPELALDRPLDVPAEIAAARRVFQQQGIDCDPRRIDIYQFGALFYRLLTGDSVLHYLYDPLGKARIPAAARAILARSLGDDPAGPWIDAGDLSAALQGVIDVEDTPAAGSAIVAPGGTPAFGALAAAGAAAPPPDARSGETRPSAVAKLPFQRLGHFEIRAQIGRGGMGDVYRAYDPSLDREVAVKVLPAVLARETGFVARFQAEAAAAAKINHPNVVPIYYIGEDQGYHFFTMQLIDGQPLSRRLAPGKPLPPDQAVAIIQQCLAGLQAAHAQSLIHRDVKPANVLIENGSGRALLVDFGLVRRVDRDAPLTATGVVMGTVDYISPEQARGQPIDHRADIYSLGVMFYQMLSGRLPFESDNATTRLFQHAYEDPLALTQAAPGTPPVLAGVVHRMMAKAPEDRYPDCAAVLADLASWRSPDALPAAAVAASAERARAPGDLSADAPAADWLADAPAWTLDRPAPAPWWTALWDRLQGLLHRHAPAIWEDLQSTEQQVDAAVAEYQRRCGELTRLVAEGEGVVRDVAAQRASVIESEGQARRRLAAATNPETQPLVQQEVDACLQRRAELDHQHAEQEEQLGDLRVKLAQVCARLAELTSQRDLLQARLKMAHAQVEHALPSRRRRSVVRSVVSAVAALGVLVLLVALVWPRRWPVVSPPTSTQPPAPQAADGQTINLLAMIDPARDTTEGTWKWEGAALVSSDEASWCTLRVPYSPPDNYTLTAVLERRGGNRGFTIGLVAGSTTCDIRIASPVQGRHISGIEHIDHLTFGDNATNVEGDPLQGQGPHAIQCAVRTLPHDEVAVALHVDGEKITDWRGASSRLSGGKERAILLRSNNNAYAVSKLELRPLRAESIVRPENAPLTVGLPPSDPLRGPFAQVQALSGGQFVPLQAGVPVTNDDRYFHWSEIPPEFQGFNYLRNNEQQGTTKFEISSPGMVLLAVIGQRYAGRGGKWQQEIVTQKGLEAEGWREIGKLNSYYKVTSSALGWLVFGRDCKRGESFSYRTEKYMAPVLIQKISEPELPPLAADGPAINLLEKVDPARDTLRGKWTWQDRRLVSASDSGTSELTIPYSVPAEYRVTAVVQRGSGSTYPHRVFGLGLPVASTSCVVCIFKDGASGINSIDGQDHNHNESAALGPPLNPGSAYTIDYTVRRAGQQNVNITMHVDGKKIVDWTGAPGRLSLEPEPADPAVHVRKPRYLSLRGKGCSFVVSKLDLRLLGTGQTVESAIRPAAVSAAEAGKPAASLYGPNAPPLAVAPFGAAQAKQHQEAWAKHLGLPVAQANSLGMPLVLIPPGEFDMGSTPEQTQWELEHAQHEAAVGGWYLRGIAAAAPRHHVRITKPYYLAMYPVTQAEYEKLMGINPSAFTEKQVAASVFKPPLPEVKMANRLDGRTKILGKDRGRHPVETVSWDEANEFCRRLSALPAERAARRVYRLATEAEFEYACRAGTTTRWYCGDDAAGVADVAWIFDNSDRMTHPVGLKKPNAWGLYDMHGNVYQWCADWYGQGYYKQSAVDDPLGPSDGAERVLRGSSWQNDASLGRSADRHAHRPPSYREPVLGFRVVAEIPHAAVAGGPH
jgi:serine/threonine protein kinase/formylglycine-generating enzyme required for sulfatase activity